MGFDVFVNTLLFGKVETVSSRIGKIKQQNNGQIPNKYPVAQILDAALEALDENHTIEAIDTDAQGHEIKFKFKDQSELTDITQPKESGGILS